MYKLQLAIYLVQLVEAAKAQFSRDYSDHLALVWAYEGWKETERDVAGYESSLEEFSFAQSMRAIDAHEGSSTPHLRNMFVNWMII
ncbi:hypothetical protein LOK49_LG14G01955 [Camellia lanceoleosa]|uniref:Uncharacterized protein n=1 Tax=Camellia lanceoleosa TaxID=1840588 RepID=A0ACC0FEQ1_9ERIC|nr:hypothetical protein LOK49_LG14G01955 [Camellia lanceoleosa]